MELRSCISFRIFPSVLIEEKPRQLLCIVTSAWSNPSLDIQKQLIGTEYSLQKSSKEANFLRLFSRAQLFEGRLALNPGLNLTLVSFSCVQKHFLG